VTLDVLTSVDAAERAVRRLELTVTRRLDGLLQGEYRGLLPGPGSELTDGRPYQVGDDVRRIDWNLTARSNEVHVRDTMADRELETWVVVDGSASMDFGTAEWEKRDLAVATVAAFGYLSCMAGSRFGMVVAGATDPVAGDDGAGDLVIPATPGREHVRRALLRLHRRPRSGTGASDLGRAVDRVRRLGRRPGVVVLVSDLLGDDRWVRPMRAAATRSHTVVCELRDPREDTLPSVGFLTLVDPETGELREVHTGSARLRQRFAEAAQARRDAMRQASRSAGADHLVLSTDRDWLLDVAHHHLSKRRSR
jgi:uncharacterized protein (DUF58 family)